MISLSNVYYTLHIGLTVYSQIVFIFKFLFYSVKEMGPILGL